MIRIDELLAELLVIKDLYICGRMNMSIAQSLTNSVKRGEANITKATLKEFKSLSTSYVNDSIQELFERHKNGSLKQVNGCYLDTIVGTNHKDFDSDLFNEMMEDYYTNTDSIAFVSSYNYFGDDFNNILLEFITPINAD